MLLTVVSTRVDNWLNNWLNGFVTLTCQLIVELQIINSMRQLIKMSMRRPFYDIWRFVSVNLNYRIIVADFLTL